MFGWISKTYTSKSNPPDLPTPRPHHLVICSARTSHGTAATTCRCRTALATSHEGDSLERELGDENWARKKFSKSSSHPFCLIATYRARFLFGAARKWGNLNMNPNEYLWEEKQVQSLNPFTRGKCVSFLWPYRDPLQNGQLKSAPNGRWVCLKIGISGCLKIRDPEIHPGFSRCPTNLLKIQQWDPGEIFHPPNWS